MKALVFVLTILDDAAFVICGACAVIVGGSMAVAGSRLWSVGEVSIGLLPERSGIAGIAVAAAGAMLLEVVARRWWTLTRHHWCEIAEDLDQAAHRLARVVHALDTGRLDRLDADARAELAELRHSYGWTPVATGELDDLRGIVARLAAGGPPLDLTGGRARCRLCGATSELPASAEHIGRPPLVADWAGVDRKAGWHYPECPWRLATEVDRPEVTTDAR